MKLIRVFIRNSFLFWLVLSSPAHAGFFLYNTELSVVDDNNVTNGARAKDIREDVFYQASVGGSFKQEIFGSQLLDYSLLLGAKSYSEFDKLNETTLRAGLKYSFQFNRSFTSLIYSVDAFVIEKASRSSIRDSTTLGLTLQLSKWFTDKTSLIAGLGVTKEEAEGVVFDIQRVRAFANLDLLFTDQWTGYATVLYVDGDIASTGENDWLKVTSAACSSLPCNAIEPDDAFGGVATNQFAYRLPAKTQIVTLGLNWKIKEGQSIDLSARLLSSKVDTADIQYDDTILRASYLLSFK